MKRYDTRDTLRLPSLEDEAEHDDKTRIEEEEPTRVWTRKESAFMKLLSVLQTS